MLSMPLAADPVWHRLGREVGRRLWPLNTGRLCAAAKQKTGLKDFGLPSLEPALSILVQSLEEQANLHPLGRLLIRLHLLELLEVRLQLTDLWREDWGTLDATPLEKPIFIVGMPRSGSTFLHELLAQDPAHRAPRVWEVMFPAGGPQRRLRERQRRLRQAEFCLWCFRRLAPGADRVYPMRANTPHECVAIHSYTFLSEEFVSTCRIPSYEAFLHDTDLTPAYQWEKRFLQHLQLDGPPKRWVLKSPDHVYGMEELFTVFPDASIIQTHRNPIEVLKSSADLTRVLRGLYGHPEPSQELRAREARVLAEGTERFIAFRDRHPELADRFIDVKYSELIAEPVAAVRRIYRALEVPLTEVAADRMHQLAAARSRYRGPRASGQAARMGLGTSLEAQRFERYCSRFGLAFQKADLR